MAGSTKEQKEFYAQEVKEFIKALSVVSKLTPDIEDLANREVLTREQCKNIMRTLRSRYYLDMLYENLNDWLNTRENQSVKSRVNKLMNNTVSNI